MTKPKRNKSRRNRKAKRRQYELRRLRRLAKAKPRHKAYQPAAKKKDETAGVSDIPYQLKAPKDFRLLKNTEKCVMFFKKVRSRDWAFKNSSGNLELHIDLSEVEHIDFASTMMLDAIVDELGVTHPICDVIGNSPIRPECSQYLKDSGFLDNKVNPLIGKQYSKLGSSDNMKIERGEVKLEDDHIKKVVEIERHICKHLTGKEDKLYKHIAIIKEICGNTVDWSDAVRDQWSYGVKFEEDKVIVVALDLGRGILDSISRRFTVLVQDMLTMQTHVQILEGAFNRKYGSKSKRRNRNRGLPSIKYANELGIIKDLTVITNNVFLDFSDPNRSHKFYWNKNRALEGTLYSWKIDKSCFENL